MRVLLVEPPKPKWTLMGDYVAPPIGLAYVASSLEEKGFEVDLLDCNALNLDWERLREYLEKGKFDVIGATATTPSFNDALKVIRLAKEVDPESITVLGGPHVTFLWREEMIKNPEIDFVVRWEGERTLANLLKALESGKDVSEVPGIAYRSGSSVSRTEDPPPLDLDELPDPAYHLLPMDRYRFPVFGKFSVVLSSRGCPHRCSFCSEWRFWRSWRKRDPKKVVDEIELLVNRYGIRSIWFGDDCFNCDGDHVRVICEEILGRGLELNWFYQGRADHVIKQEEMLAVMKEAGNLMAQLGIESSSNEELSRMKKGLSVNQVKRAVELLKQNDILVQGLIIVGTWEDSYESIIEKVNYMKRLKVDFPIYTILTPFPGSELYEKVKDRVEVADFRMYDMAHAVMPTKYLSRRQVMRLYYECYKLTYTDPMNLVRNLFSRNAWRRGIWWHMTKLMLRSMLPF